MNRRFALTQCVKIVQLCRSTEFAIVARPPKSTQAITANRLTDGRVVFLTAAESWDHSVDKAAVYADPAAAEAGLAIAAKAAAAGEIVDAYAIAVAAENGHVTPTILRERIRATGPTIDAEPAA